jgi:hypothetical protein
MRDHGLLTWAATVRFWNSCVRDWDGLLQPVLLQESGVQEICVLRSRWRGLETES